MYSPIVMDTINVGEKCVLITHADHFLLEVTVSLLEQNVKKIFADPGENSEQPEQNFGQDSRS